LILTYFLIISLYQIQHINLCREQANIVYYRQPPQKPASKYKTNEKIQAQEVRVIDADGQNLGVLKTEEAVKLAKEKGLDLIEIAKTPKETVARVADLGKFTYQQEKAEKKQKEKQGKNELKGVRLKLMIQPHDMETKAKQAEKFLKQGHNIEINMFLRGREKSRMNEAKEKLRSFVSLIPIPTKILQDGIGPRGPRIMIGKA